MKKFLTMMLMALPLLGLTACHDDDDVPDVDFNIAIENAVRADGYLYVVQGETMEVASIEVKNNDAGKPAMITAANYYWDYRYIGSSIEPPYGMEIEISETTPTGEHLLEIECPLFAEDKAAATAIVSFNVKVVSDQSELPDTGEQTFTVHPKTASTAE
ncbi:MAG: hypothetical protein NC418_11380 [Muribaculaceae bacterium]|nr:hypothetical protein [Muribaculaceae bacterium]